MILKTKFSFHPNPKIYVLLTFLILIASNMQSCKKDVLMPNARQLPNSIENVKSAFFKGNYQKELSTNFMDTIHITWVPNWKESRSRPVNDTLSYLYIPLDGKLTTTKHPQERKMVTVNTEKYIVASIVNNQVNFKLATYTTTNTKTEQKSTKTAEQKRFINHSILFSKFEGKAIIKDLKNNSTNYYTYASGISNKNKLSSAKPNGSNKLSAYREVCSYYLICLWINNFPMYCGNVSYGETQSIVNDVNSIDECYMPPGGYWSDGYNACVPDWTFGGSYVTKGDCYYWPEPDPVPTDPGESGGSGGGGDGGENSSESNVIPEDPYMPGQDHPAINPKDYIKCFENIPDAGASYKISVQVQEPFENSDWNYGKNGVGHTAITLTKTGSNGESITQTIGFYPAANKFEGPSKIVNNGNDMDFTIQMNFDIGTNDEKFNAILNYISNPPKTYGLMGVNCTYFINEACKKGDLVLPSAWSNIAGFMDPLNVAQVMTPAGLGQSMRSLKNNNDNRIKTNPGKAPSSKGPC